MKHISADLKRPVKGGRETERGELLKYFMERLNSARLSDGLPPMKIARIGFMLAKIPTKDLYYLKKVCDDALNFSKKFWYELNPEKYNAKAKAPPWKKKPQRNE